MRVTYYSIKNTKQMDKPNEDAALCDLERNIFILLDGVSRDNKDGRYPNPSPAVNVVHILKEEIYKGLRDNIRQADILNTIQKVIKQANEAVYSYNKKNNLIFPAGAVGIVLMLQEEKMYYAYIGDCYGRVISKKHVEIFTECQTKLITQHKKEYTSHEIREIICNNDKHPYGYGVLNGNMNALRFVRLGEMDISNINQILLSSDGMENYLSQCSLKILMEKDAEMLVKTAVEKNNNKQDDRTIVKIELREWTDEKDSN